MCIYFYVYYIAEYIYIYIFLIHIHRLHFKSLLCVYFHFIQGRASIQSMQSDPKVLYGFRPQNWKRRRAMRRWCGEAMGKCDRRWPTWSDRQPFRQSASANNSFNRSLTKLQTEYTQLRSVENSFQIIGKCFRWLQVTCHIMVMFFVTCI